jgi:hypothetical protein
MIIDADNVKKTFIGQFINDLEEKSGYDDYTRFLYYILHEKKLGKESKWSPFLGRIMSNY